VDNDLVGGGSFPEKDCASGRTKKVAVFSMGWLMFSRTYCTRRVADEPVCLRWSLGRKVFCRGSLWLLALVQDCSGLVEPRKFDPQKREVFALRWHDGSGWHKDREVQADP
jgi:hypothetical protein